MNIIINDEVYNLVLDKNINGINMKEYILDGETLDDWNTLYSEYTIPNIPPEKLDQFVLSSLETLSHLIVDKPNIAKVSDINGNEYLGVRMNMKNDIRKIFEYTSQKWFVNEENIVCYSQFSFSIPYDKSHNIKWKKSIEKKWDNSFKDFLQRPLF